MIYASRSFYGYVTIDIIEKIVIIGSFTFGALFSVTKLYYSITKDLSGDSMLRGAFRRLSDSLTKPTNKD